MNAPAAKRRSEGSVPGYKGASQFIVHCNNYIALQNHDKRPIWVTPFKALIRMEKWRRCLKGKAQTGVIAAPAAGTNIGFSRRQKAVSRAPCRSRNFLSSSVSCWSRSA